MFCDFKSRIAYHGFEPGLFKARPEISKFFLRLFVFVLFEIRNHKCSVLSQYSIRFAKTRERIRKMM